jgi:putative sterol carrier protein
MTAISTADFFDDLSRRGHEPLLSRVSATVRFDITDGDRTEHRMVRIDRGDIRMSASEGQADCVLGADRAAFDAIVGGRMTVMVALLLGVLAIDGDPELLVLTQRLFPGPASASSGRGAVAGGRRTS